jgi:hypothetical protein
MAAETIAQITARRAGQYPDPIRKAMMRMRAYTKHPQKKAIAAPTNPKIGISSRGNTMLKPLPRHSTAITILGELRAKSQNPNGQETNRKNIPQVIQERSGNAGSKLLSYKKYMQGRPNVSNTAMSGTPNNKPAWICRSKISLASDDVFAADMRGKKSAPIDAKMNPGRLPEIANAA